ncbi:zinc-dependent alcohol dehydrogenase, partial [Staphylococcus sp. SIMBA_130]
TRKDLMEALQFAAEGKVKTIIETRPVEEINQIFEELENGNINGRVVLTFE